MENAKNSKFKCDILGDIQTLCNLLKVVKRKLKHFKGKIAASKSSAVLLHHKILAILK